ncbi:MAG: glycosyltransferase, partial [Cyanobacteria bacterium]|nr:glycosyltransferase [Cyanobacteriota bacterium]MDW8202549.1 glycosyltransferase [Cyanobacteriota bacterium SKYGB_h_bin112]
VEQSMLAAGIVQGRVIPYGIDVELFQPTSDKRTLRSQLGLPLDARIIFSTGNYIRTSRWKDYPTMRSAMVEVAKQLPDQHLLFLVLGLEDIPSEQMGNLEIRFLPHQSDRGVVQHYQAADLYLHAAKADTFPLSVLEALACGMPVIATKTGGIPEQVDHGDTGFLVDPGDVQDMARWLTTLLLDAERLAAMGTSAVNAAHQRFALQRMIDDYLTWYQEILQGHGKLL